MISNLQIFSLALSTIAVALAVWAKLEAGKLVRDFRLEGAQRAETASSPTQWAKIMDARRANPIEPVARHFRESR